MKNIEYLQKEFILYNFGLHKIDGCINWAIDNLSSCDEKGDKDIVLLAGSIEEEEARELTLKILQRYLSDADVSKEYFCGKYIVDLFHRYKDKNIEIEELDIIFTKLFNGLGYPNWLVMLARNCEYATDVEPFVKHFEDEFEYIANLWEVSDSLDSFNQKYDRAISNTHDIEYC